MRQEVVKMLWLQNYKIFFYIIPFFVFLILSLLFVFQLISKHDPYQIQSVLIGKKFPEVQLPPLIQGEEGLESKKLNGQVFLINIFASWCVPCLAEHEILMSLKKEGILIKGISYKDNINDSIAFIEKNGNPYDSIGIDNDGRFGIELGMYGIPETFLLDSKGIIRYRHAGQITESLLQKELMPLINKLKLEN